MTRERIADALGRTEYGEHPDEVDRADRLTQVDALLATGAVIDPDALEGLIRTWTAHGARTNNPSYAGCAQQLRHLIDHRSAP